jgi:hypothetical protein
MQFRFIGESSTIAGRTYTRFGQPVELDEQTAHAVLTSSPPAPIISEAGWLESGITDAEASNWPSVLIHGNAPKEFKDKRAALWEKIHIEREAAANQPAPANVAAQHDDQPVGQHDSEAR